VSSQPRYFGLEEANAVVRMIRPLLAEVMQIRQLILDRQADAWPAVEQAAGNGGNRAASELVQEFARLDQLVREIQATGAIIKDINVGLVDFPALRQGREVYLCWKYGEEQINFWHEIDAGFSGRRPVDEF
jgi:hypothetical protein